MTGLLEFAMTPESLYFVLRSVPSVALFLAIKLAGTGTFLNLYIHWLPHDEEKSVPISPTSHRKG